MKRLMIGISALAFAAGMAGTAHATCSVSCVDQITVGSAWKDRAATPDPIHPMTPTPPTPPGEVNPQKPDPFEIEMRMFKHPVKGQSAYVDQAGLNNDINIDQDNAGSGAVADVIQIGNDNDASVEQQATGSQNAGSYAVITSNGNDNDAAIRQSNDAGPADNGPHYADIQQGGDTMTGSKSNSKAFGNSASIEQGVDGNGNLTTSTSLKAKILQEGIETGVAVGNEAKIRQNGDNMFARIDQDGGWNQASIIQVGFGDSAGGFGFENNEASISQVGFYNDAATYQEGIGNGSQIDQDGNFNVASHSQTGVDNTALTVQTGYKNLSVIWQDGEGNMASAIQDGLYNKSWITQDGDSNMAEVEQFNGYNYSAVEQLGNANNAAVFQNGHDLADVQQTGNYNTAYVTQGMNSFALKSVSGSR